LGVLTKPKTVKYIKILSLIATIAFLGVVAFFVWFAIAWSRDEARAAQNREDRRSGKWDFGEQPALFAVAQAIVRNDPEGICAAAKNVPDLNAAGRDGTTLLFFAVGQTFHNEPLLDALKTLLSLGADPNYNNGQPFSFALVEAGRAAAPVLGVMLEAGGDPNGRDKDGVPIIFSNWDVSAYDSQSRARSKLLLDRGLDINATVPETGRCCVGASVVLYRTAMGLEDPIAYDDALHLLELGADPHRPTSKGITLAQKLVEHREKFAQENKAPPGQFIALWDWAQAHAILPPE
jgi:hypothetical protein